MARLGSWFSKGDRHRQPSGRVIGVTQGSELRAATVALVLGGRMEEVTFELAQKR